MYSPPMFAFGPASGPCVSPLTSPDTWLERVEGIDGETASELKHRWTSLKFALRDPDAAFRSDNHTAALFSAMTKTELNDALSASCFDHLNQDEMNNVFADIDVEAWEGLGPSLMESLPLVQHPSPQKPTVINITARPKRVLMPCPARITGNINEKRPLPPILPRIDQLSHLPRNISIKRHRSNDLARCSCHMQLWKKQQALMRKRQNAFRPELQQF